MPGISGFSLYLPPYKVDLAQWCEWTGQPWAKIGKVVGHSFRMRGPEQDVYCLAANAVLRLIRNYELDPANIGLLALGTESSADNSAGAVIVKGLVDDALAVLGYPPLARDCEVPEFKHACLGGVYALKSAARYVATDGVHRQAIVVSADIAEYALGSSGEPTQGAGAVAMLVEAEPRLLELDLAGGGSASAYRVVDFRKPFTRFAEQRPGPLGQLQDLPVFNGHYSTHCYVDAVRAAMAAMLAKHNGAWAPYYRTLDAAFMHRPYHRMPESGWGMAYLFALAHDRDPQLAALAEAADINPEDLLNELSSPSEIGTAGREAASAGPAWPLANALLQSFRNSESYRENIGAKLSLGAGKMLGLGNLYTAALPAWLAAGMEAGLQDNLALDGQHWLAVGYGSGDAAEAIPMRVVHGWQASARRIGFDQALVDPLVLNSNEYRLLHAGDASARLWREVREEFVIEAIGTRDDADFSDAGIAYHRFAA